MNPALATRLRFGFAVMLVLLIGVTAVGVGRLFDLRRDFEDANSRAFQVELAGERMRSAFVLQQAALERARADRGDARANFRRAAEVSRRAARAALELTDGSGSAADLIRERRRAERRWRERVAEPLLRGRTPPERTQTRLASAVVRADNALISGRQEAREALRREVRADTRSTMVLVAAGLLAAFLAAVATFSGLLGSMRRPLDSLVAAARRLSSGDLAARAEVGGPAETSQLGQAFNEMASDLEGSYRRIEDERVRLAVMVESLGDGVITVDRSGRIRLANPIARRLLPQASPGSDIDDAIGGLASEREILHRMVSGGSTGELRLVDGDRVLSVSVAPLATTEGGAVFSIRDVSEQVRLDKMKDEFVATVSHELRSPLTSIKGFAELLMLESEGLTESQAESVRIITESTETLVELVNGLLDLARSDAGRLSLSPEPCAIEPIVSEVAALISPRVEQKGQRLEASPRDGLPMLFADPERVKQILFNLVTNAHLYTPPGGNIAISARVVSEGVELSVSDDGPGIPADDREHLFERFWRGDAGESQQVGGTGLGLPIVKSLVDAHGGEISLDSEPGQGSTFRILLPAIDPERVPMDRPSAERHVLLVEEEPAIARLLVRRFAESGVGSEIARTGDRALTRLREAPFDLVLLDLRLGATGSFGLLGTLRSDPELARIPIAAVSIFAGREGQLGERLVAPPIEADALPNAVAAMLEEGRHPMVACAEPRRRARVAAAFAAHGLQPRITDSAEETLAIARTAPFDVLLIDASLPNAAALKRAADDGAIEGSPPRVVVLESSGEGGRPPVITLEQLVERAATALDVAASRIPAMPQGEER